MQSHLMISDLSTSRELDRLAMAAVRGGSQSNGVSQTNAQNMSTAVAVGSGSVFGGPTTIQSDNTFAQTTHNKNCDANFKGFSIGYPMLGGVVPV